MLVVYEYAAKPPRSASVNFRWAITREGVYLKSQNPSGVIRPTGEDLYWYAGPWQEQKRLTPEELEGVLALVASCPLASARHLPQGSAANGDWSRLTVARPDGEVVVEVEDRADTSHEAWIAGLVALLMPELAAIREQVERS